MRNVALLLIEIKHVKKIKKQNINKQKYIQIIKKNEKSK